MPNTFVSSTAFGKALDEKFIIESKSAFLLDTSMDVQFRGNGKITLTDEELTGLGDFLEKYPEGEVTLTQTDYTLTQDRSAKFKLDDTKIRHTGINNYAPGLCGRFVKKMVAPEVDAYMFSKGYQVAKVAGNVENGANADAFHNKSFSILRSLINSCEDIVGDGEQLVALMDGNFSADLFATSEINRRIDISNFKKGNIDTKVKTIDGCGLIKVPSLRMKTAYEFGTGWNNGETETNFGFKAAADAVNLGCLVLPKSGALRLIKELEKTKYFSPETDDDGDNHRILYHILYDGIVKKSAANTIFAYTYGK